MRPIAQIPAPRSTHGRDYAGVAAALTSMIEREREQKGLEAFSIALVDGDEVVWAAGFGEQDPERGVPASAETVYPVSKLFTDIAVMQLVERGELDLDAPVRNYLPEFAPENPSGTEITLRQLMSHRSGLIREPPAGHYFDDTGTDLAATVASLSGTPQIYPPTERTKYSNAGIAVAGYTLEVTRGGRHLPHRSRASRRGTAGGGAGRLSALESMWAPQFAPEGETSGSFPCRSASELARPWRRDLRVLDPARLPARGEDRGGGRLGGRWHEHRDGARRGRRPRAMLAAKAGEPLPEASPTLSIGARPRGAPRRLARRPDPGPPPETPAHWAGLIGEYGRDSTSSTSCVRAASTPSSSGSSSIPWR